MSTDTKSRMIVHRAIHDRVAIELGSAVTRSGLAIMDHPDTRYLIASYVCQEPMYKLILDMNIIDIEELCVSIAEKIRQHHYGDSVLCGTHK